MLFDPKWGVKAKADTFSVAGLIAWLETQDQSTEYEWFNIDGCLVCHYLKAVTGSKRPAAEWAMDGDLLGPNWGYGEICFTSPWTYGAALSRARKLSASAEHAGDSK